MKSQKTTSKQVRLNKFLSDAGVDSRRKVEEYILTGRVDVNGETVVNLSVKVDPDKDVVTVDGEKVKTESKVYYILHKPKGYITTTSDEKDRAKVTDLIKTSKRIFPVGRLDRDTTGILFLTNDGDFANTLMHPKYDVEREYIVKLDRELLDNDKERLINTGVYLDKKKSTFKRVYTVSKKTTKYYNVITNEGKYHFVKKMFNALGYKVESLHRMRFGDFTADGLKVGSYIKVDKSVILNYLEKHVK